MHEVYIWKNMYSVRDIPVKEVAFVATQSMSVSTAALITCCSNMATAHKLLCPLE
jgi:hypothetical protein